MHAAIVTILIFLVWMIFCVFAVVAFKLRADIKDKYRRILEEDGRDDETYRDWVKFLEADNELFYAKHYKNDSPRSL